MAGEMLSVWEHFLKFPFLPCLTAVCFAASAEWSKGTLIKFYECLKASNTMTRFGSKLSKQQQKWSQKVWNFPWRREGGKGGMPPYPCTLYYASTSIAIKCTLETPFSIFLDPLQVFFSHYRATEAKRCRTRALHIYLNLFVYFLWKGGFMYAIKVHIGHLLGGSGGMLPLRCIKDWLLPLKIVRQCKSHWIIPWSWYFVRAYSPSNSI